MEDQNYVTERALPRETAKKFKARMVEKAIAEDMGIICYVVGTKEIPADGKITGRGERSCKLQKTPADD